MNPKSQIRGLWVPLVTPFYGGEFDSQSMIKLIKTIEPSIDGFVACLSSGEGGEMSNVLWEEVLKTVTQNASKPVAVGVLRNTISEIVYCSVIAKKYGCLAITVAIQGNSMEKQKVFCKEISDKSALPVILYNTVENHIDDTEELLTISKNENIIALKDSSQNQKFFNDAVRTKKERKMNMSILQGMENQLLESVGCDGFLVALANVEPKLCRDMFTNPSRELNEKIMEKWNKLNLASETWYIGIKEALNFRGIIKSPELIKNYE